MIIFELENKFLEKIVIGESYCDSLIGNDVSAINMHLKVRREVMGHRTHFRVGFQFLFALRAEVVSPSCTADTHYGENSINDFFAITKNTDENVRFFMVVDTGLEPVTPCMSSKCSSQLS